MPIRQTMFGCSSTLKQQQKNEVPLGQKTSAFVDAKRFSASVGERVGRLSRKQSVSQTLQSEVRSRDRSRDAPAYKGRAPAWSTSRWSLRGDYSTNSPVAADTCLLLLLLPACCCCCLLLLPALLLLLLILLLLLVLLLSLPA